MHSCGHMHLYYVVLEHSVSRAYAHLNEHVKANHKEFVNTRSLTQLVGKRRRFLFYSLTPILAPSVMWLIYSPLSRLWGDCRP